MREPSTSLERVNAQILALADERVERAPAASCFVQRDEHAVRGEDAVVDALEIVVADRAALPPHDGDELVEQPLAP